MGGGGGGAKQGGASPPFPVSLGPWPMRGGKGAAGALAASAAAATSARGRALAVGLSGPVAHLNLNYKGAEGTCREADARNTRSFTPPIPSVEVSLYLQPTLPPGAGRGFGPAHQQQQQLAGWGSVRLAVPADACVLMQCDSDGGGGGAKQGSASSPFPRRLDQSMALVPLI